MHTNACAHLANLQQLGRTGVIIDKISLFLNVELLAFREPALGPVHVAAGFPMIVKSFWDVQLDFTTCSCSSAQVAATAVAFQ